MEEDNINKENNDKLDKKFIIKSVFIILLGLIGMSLIFTVVSIIAMMIDPVLSLNPLPENMEAHYYTVNGALQCIAYVLSLLVALLILGKEEIAKAFSKYKNLSAYLKGITYGLVLLLAQSLYSIVISAIYKAPVEDNQNQKALISLTQYAPLLMGLTTVVLAPIFEEICYRYCFFGSLRKINRILAYVIAGIIFGLIHFDFTCFSNKAQMINELLNLPAYILSGLILCFAYDKENSLITSISAHATNNLIAFVQILLIYGK